MWLPAGFGYVEVRRQHERPCHHRDRLRCHDTLWQNEQFYRLTEKRFDAARAAWREAEAISNRLLEAERRNLKPSTASASRASRSSSMIETAIEVTEVVVDPGRHRRRFRLCRARSAHPSGGDFALRPAPRSSELARQLSPHPDHQRRPVRPGAQAGPIRPRRPVRRAVEIVSDKIGRHL